MLYRGGPNDQIESTATYRRGQAGRHVLLTNEASQIREKDDPEQTWLVMLKFFWRTYESRSAEALGVGKRTVDRLSFQEPHLIRG